VPSITDLVSGRVEVSALRPVEISDLLLRAPIATDFAKVAELTGNHTVMVSGDGGSTCSELCRQIAAISAKLPQTWTCGCHPRWRLRHR